MVRSRSRRRDITIARGDVDGRREASLDATLPLSRLHAGNYVLELDVRTPNGDMASRAIPVSIR